MDIPRRLTELADTTYRDFHSRLVPTLPKESILGVRVPKLRALARELRGSDAAREFMNALPHEYYDENMLHALLINEERDFDTCYAELLRFLPHVDNWAVCDALAPRALLRDTARLEALARQCTEAEHVYTVRFGIVLYMKYFLDGGFKPEFATRVASIVNSDYYVRAGVAWYFATALAKQWDVALALLKGGSLDGATRALAIRKACESYRISDEKKALLKRLATANKQQSSTKISKTIN